ncbi:MAG: hypothetical protein ACKOPE_14540 [Novosphingobium sp.]
MRPFLLAFSAAVLASILAIPTVAASAKPAATDCAAAADAHRSYWLDRSDKDPATAQQEVQVADAVLAVLGEQPISTEQRSKYKALNPDMRGVFLRRCAIQYPASS